MGTRATIGAMNFLGQTALIVAVTSFAVGISVLSRNVRNKLFITFSILTSVVSAWALSFFMETLWGGGTFYQFHLLFNIWIAPAGLGFIQVMMRIHDKPSRRLLDVTSLLALLLSMILALHLADRIPLVIQLIYFTPVVIILQILRLMWIDRSHRKSPKRPARLTLGLARRNLIYFGGLIVLATSVMDHVPWLGSTIPSFGNLLLTVYLFFLGQAVTQQRLLNFSALFTRFIVLLLVALILTGIYSLLVVWIENSPSLFFLNSFIVSFLLVMLLDPLRSFVSYSTQRFLGQKHHHLQQTLRDQQRILTGIVDLGSLFDGLLQAAQEMLQPDWIALFLLRSDGTKYRRVRSVGQELPNTNVPKELIVNHPLLQHAEALYKKGDLPIIVDQILENEVDRSASRAQRENLTNLIQGLRALGSNLLIPLIDSGRILGFLTLRASAPPEAWGPNWGLLPIIYPYFEQSAQSMRNMEIFVKQREKERLAALGEMAAGLAHEIRNPLGAIKGAAQFLDPTSERPESRFLKVILEEVDRLNRVVTQFLDYSKPPATNFNRIDLSQLTGKIVELMRPSVPNGVKIEFRPSQQPAHAMAAGDQIQQVLINLIQNSVKALEGKTAQLIRIAVDAEAVDGPHGEVTISVEDNGHGIKKENLEKLFIPFFTTSPSGTGLGLSISHKIVEAHRGRIDVLTEEGRFTKISVILPISKGSKET